jgi:unsaturated rhamnogalacturonyl hydrolase
MNQPNILKSIATAGIAFLAFTTSMQAQPLPNKKEVLKVMQLTNQYFMQKWPDPGKEITTNKTRPSNIWTRGVYYEGLMALYQLDKDKKYYDYAVDFGEKHQWNLRGGIGTRNADDQTCGQTYIDLYQIDRKPGRIKNIKLSIDSMMKTDKINDWTWVDALQMAMPVYAKLGVQYKDKAYFERMYQMYNNTKTIEGGGLYNAKEHLWWRDKDFVPPYKEPNGANCYWSRGNGWVFAALVRVMDVMPKTEAHRKEYLKTFKEMAAALVPLQRTDGFWNVSLMDPTHFGGKETTGTALFVYGMAWGINNGVLDAKTYRPVLLKAWNAMVKDAVHPDGMLGFVQGTGKEPKDSQPVSYTNIPDFEDYGLGCFLLAGSEVYQLKK